MRVVLADIDLDAAASVAAGLTADGAEAWAEHVDVRDPVSVDDLARSAWARGSVALLVNNAGVEQIGYLWETSEESWRRVWEVNVSGVFHGIRSFVPRMIAAGGGARVWNVASIGAISGMPMQASYIASKHAVLGLTESLRMDLAQAGHPIEVAAVLPAPVASRIFADAELTAEGDIEAAQQVQRMMTELLRSAQDPDAAAREIFRQGTAGEFYILPDEALGEERMRVRAERLLRREAPSAARSAG
ncbi:SDR family NAD(P)-dependent oxidoreductase [Microbacterium sp. NIBRBAC000506063]|uniref:SDR family NAD(P)-dependent oxidoreductase n=1 Tax=Microbacterium sp. NIBRBAC000506063 TaxID=2734618 RepID=UPI001BB65825|nr:SDR family NAD(P)-dependent oxidoreductase [Microbacterium sp. NIBRBAC000506063]QTV79087.1 SDR family NAD(P)-dependent oxidoreductase [Microbacterium sp. NIBRBAC000506063]